MREKVNKVPREQALLEKLIFLSLAFYNAPSLHTVNKNDFGASPKMTNWWSEEPVISLMCILFALRSFQGSKSS